ncbi:hypothetical protein, partial [Bartonella pachyuromydis]|uniref:hypothetical protein n=1 Tax=Bartonella pachyuromydis TaxID=931097 RepID=UPI0031EDC2EB
ASIFFYDAFVYSSCGKHLKKDAFNLKKDAFNLKKDAFNSYKILILNKKKPYKNKKKQEKTQSMWKTCKFSNQKLLLVKK